MKEFRKRPFYGVAICASFLAFIYSPIAYTAETAEGLLAAASSPANVESDTYTINFNNVAIIELIRFASKITNLNFIFEEPDLQFNVTVVSEEAVNARNVMSALTQVLRMHDFLLLEQEGNIIITKSRSVNQIPTILSADLPGSTAANAAIVTRVFRIKNANLNTVATIIRPMVSSTSLIEVSNETRQLIVTDVTTNVEKIGELLASIDSPHTPLEMEAYVAKNSAPADLIELVRQIITPFAEGNPVIFVPQIDTNTIFIVSTPYLIERAMTALEDLDVPSKPVVLGKASAMSKNVFLYKAMNRAPAELILELRQISGQLSSMGGPASPLELAIQSAQEVKDTSSIAFLADPSTTSKLQDILNNLDSPTLGKTSFYIYKIQRAHETQIAQSLTQMVDRLQVGPEPDLDLINAIQSMRWIKETNSLVFTGTPGSLKSLSDIVPTFDVSPTQARTGEQAATKSSFLIYNPTNRSGDELASEIRDIDFNLKNSGLADPSLLQALDSTKWVPSTNSLIFTGDPQSLERVKSIVESIDNVQKTASSRGFYLYKLQNAQGDIVIAELQDLTSKLSTDTVLNQNLINAVKNIEWVRSNNSLLITGTSDAIEQLKVLIPEFDMGGMIPSASSFFIYKPVYLPGNEVQGALVDLASELQQSGLNDPLLIQSLKTSRYVEASSSILFTGSPETIDKVKTLLSTIDVSTSAVGIQQIGNLSFLIYKLQYVSADQLMASLKGFGQDLKASNVADEHLLHAIDTMRWIKETNSILFTGTPDALQRLETLAQKFDIPSLSTGGPSAPRGPVTFVLYNPKYLSGEELISILCDFEQNLVTSGVSDPGLFDTINNLKWIPKTSSLLVSGDQASIDTVTGLLQKFDLPTKEGATPSIESIDNTSFLVYKLQYHAGEDIQNALKQVSLSLSKGTDANASLAGAIDSLQWIQVTNSLIGTGPQEVLVKLKELIQNLDVPLRQVFIEVLVINTTLFNAQNFGLQWGSQVKYMNKTVLQTGNFPLTTTQNSGASGLPNLAQAGNPNLQQINALTTPTNLSIPFSTGFDLGVIGDIIMNKGKSFISLGSLVNALQTDNDSTIVINQKIITQDNKQSTLFVGSNIPYTGALVTNVATSTVQTANIEYRDVGVSLTITPILGDNDVVTLDIVQDISQVVNATSNTVNTQQVTGIQTSHTHMETNVHVPNNKFLILSGSIQDSKTHFRTQIPCLGGLPVIGALFSEDDRNASKDNIVIFIRPQIINSYDEWKEITEHQEWMYKDQARLPVLKEEFDEAIDLVKTPENE